MIHLSFYGVVLLHDLYSIKSAFLAIAAFQSCSVECCDAHFVLHFICISPSRETSRLPWHTVTTFGIDCLKSFDLIEIVFLW